MIYDSRYKKSFEHLMRAEESIPLGSQTFSKSRTQFPVGVSPLFIERARGPYVWDLDGNKYIDLVNSLASITIGYGDKEIEREVIKQLKKGVSFSLPGKLEAEVAELIIKLVPSAELVRFGKNGTDATSAAIRLARAYTSRDEVIVCGYHGWQDWYIGSTTRDKGVPASTKSLTHKFKYNDISTLEDIFLNRKNKIAAVIMEPMNSEWPINNFLENVRKISSQNGSLLIFDETITGFRFSEGGAQELFNVIPDLTTLGKGIANGFPLSAITGKKEIMKEMEEIFISGTFGGELLSLSAAKVALSKHCDKKVVSPLRKNGQYLLDAINEIIRDCNLGYVLSLSGHPSWIFLNWRNIENYSAQQIKTFFMQEMFSSGILITNTHNLSLAIGKKQLKRIVKVYRKVLRRLELEIMNNTLEQNLKVPPLVPLFKIR
jgi:glutamate-1-semialdehyde 2,1-aminomutase